MSDVQKELLALRDETYRDFQCALMPTVPREKVIGVRMPALRRFAAAFAKTPEKEAFLAALPHAYYEENNLHGLLICRIREYDAAVAALERFLPCVDNWATCDLLRPKAFASRSAALPEQLAAWLHAAHPYTVRFAMEMLMLHYLDEAFDERYLGWVAAVRSEEYYVNMMAAWYFATALARQYDSAVVYLQERRLALWTHNKTIQKAVESFRITPEQKTYLRSLRRKS